KPPDETPLATRQSNLTDPDSALMRRSEAHEYRQAYNAQAVVCAEGTQLILATNLVATPADAPSFAATILAMDKTIGLPQVVLADAGFASGAAVAELEARKIEPLVAIARTQPQRFPPAAQATARAAHRRTLAHRHEGQAGDRGGQSPLQETQADRRTRLRHRQERHGLHPVPPARHRQRRR